MPSKQMGLTQTHQLAKKTRDMTTWTKMVNCSTERESVTRRALSAGGRRQMLNRAYLSDLFIRVVIGGQCLESEADGDATSSQSLSYQ
jgi:hypothetical protein